MSFNFLKKIKLGSMSRNYLSYIVNNVPNFLCWKNEHGVFLGCNIKFAQSAGLPFPEQIIGKTDYEMPWAESAAIYVADDQKVMALGIPKLNYEESQYQSDGTYKIMLVSKVPILENNKPIGIICIYTDIDMRKQMEADLLQANEIICAKNLAQTQFIQNMQHDFRTPASGVWSMLSSLVEEETDLEKKKLLTLARDANKQIYDICTEIVDFGKIEQVAIPVINKRFSMESIIKNIIELHRPAAFVKKISLDYSIDPNLPAVISGDEYRINRILINLVANAIKFTNTGSVFVAAKIGKISGKDIIVQLEIADTGIGIPFDQQMLIYEKFNRLTPSNAGIYKGTGLGLRIVKQFVEELGGEIEVTSEINQGSTFYVICSFKKPLLDIVHNVLPINSAVAKLVNVVIHKQTIDNSSKVKPDIPHILLIEDNPLARLGALKTLEAYSIVSDVENVAQARSLLNSTKFDLVISDLGLPDGSGNDIVSEAKANPQSLNYDTPFLALTAHDDPINIAAAEKSGFLLVMLKPLLQHQVPELLNTYITSLDEKNCTI